MDKYKAAENMGFFLLEKTGTIYGYWYGHMPAKQQRELFGMFLGKGTIHMNGAKETLVHSKTVCFGTDFEWTFHKKWVFLDVPGNFNPDGEI